MDIRSVITGDVVNSTSLDMESKKYLIESIWQMSNELQNVLSPIDIYAYRGDSFQMLIEKPETALLVAILLRAGLRARTPASSSVLWDVRLSIGVGEVSYIDEHLAISDGEAFRFSGLGLDEIGKKRLLVRTCNQEINEELAVSTAFADDIITGWTPGQAQLIWTSLLNGTSQKDIAADVGTSVQNVNKLLNTAKENLIVLYLKRFEQIVEHNFK